jgi:hypothetical protein
MKRLILGLLTIVLILGLNGCSDNEEKVQSKREVKTLNNLPKKDDLSYISNLDTLLGFNMNTNSNFLDVIPVKKMYSQGIKGYMIKIWGSSTFLDFSKVNEFEIENKITPLMKNAIKIIQNDKNNYLKRYKASSFPLQISLKNKSLPIKFNRNGLISISKQDIITFSKNINSLHNIKSHTLAIKLFGENVSKYISKKSNNKDKNIVYGAKINLSEYGLQIRNKTSDDKKYIYKLGKINLGKDNLVDITIGAIGSGKVIPFKITSFKFEKASKERFYLIYHDYVSETYIKAMYKRLKSDESTSDKTLKIRMLAYEDDYMYKNPSLLQLITNAYNTIVAYRKIVNLR